jgi:hypothetical protein
MARFISKSKHENHTTPSNDTAMTCVQAWHNGNSSSIAVTSTPPQQHYTNNNFNNISKNIKTSILPPPDLAPIPPCRASSQDVRFFLTHENQTCWLKF